MASLLKASDKNRRDRRRTDSGGGRIPAQLRHQQIMSAFHQNGFISVTDVAERIGVSTMTIRRDLVLLEQEGRITRTHGGAIAAMDNAKDGGDDEESIFDRRLAKNAAAKSAIAHAAAALVGPSLSLGLDAGTTILTAAQLLSGRADLRIFTNNLRAALALAGMGSPVYVLGGEVRVPELSVVGSAAIKILKSHFLDLVFVGVSAIDEYGMYDFSPEDTEVKRAFIDSATRVVVLCDASKFAQRALARVDGLEAIDILVTNQEPPPRLAAALRDAKVEVRVAAAERPIASAR
ncbi:MAG: DeoR/GlpR family DNA-binding transcription regulator [Steroidobacteraceae bacterium]